MTPLESKRSHAGDRAGGASGRTEGIHGTNERGQPILQVLDAYKAAVLAKDIEGFVALYDQDVCVYDMWGQWSYDGVAAWRGMVADWFGSLGNERVAIEMDDVRVLIAGDLAVAHAFVTFKGLSVEGSELRSMTNRLTWTLQRADDGVWRVVHEHTSAPIDFQTSKVLLQR